MTALGKTLAASTLAVGLAFFVGGTASATSYNDWGHKDKKDYKRDYKHDNDNKWDKDYNKRDFYKLSWDDRNRVCNDKDNWDWHWFHGELKDKCNDFRYDKDHGKDYGKKYDKHYDNDKNYGWKDKDDDYYAKDYNKDESYRDSYSKKDSDHEKKAYYVTASTSDSDKYGSDHYNKGYDYGHDYKDKGDKYGKHDGWKDKGHDSYSKSNDSDYSYRNDSSDYTLAGYHEKDSTNYVKADVAQDVNVNNHVKVYGDNNVVYNTVNVANYAALDQKATSNEVDYKAVSYNTSSDSGYGNDYDKSYGHDGWKDGSYGSYGGSEYGKSSHDASYAAVEYSEKSSSSEVKKETSYNLDEEYKQVEHEDDDCDDHYKKYGVHKYDDCDDDHDYDNWN